MNSTTESERNASAPEVPPAEDEAHARKEGQAREEGRRQKRCPAKLKPCQHSRHHTRGRLPFSRATSVLMAALAPGSLRSPSRPPALQLPGASSYPPPRPGRPNHPLNQVLCNLIELGRRQLVRVNVEACEQSSDFAQWRAHCLRPPAGQQDRGPLGFLALDHELRWQPASVPYKRLKPPLVV